MTDVTAPQIALKQPGESLVYSMDFVHLLFPGETIKASPPPTISATPTGDPDDLIISSPIVTGSVVSFRIAQGRDGYDYAVQVLVLTDFGSDDNVRIGDGILQVRDS